MNDDDLDWISLDDAATYVEATQKCYRQKAIDLLRQAADGLKLKSRTVNSSPRWIVSNIAGEKVYYSDGGQRIEVSREDIRKLWPEGQHGATRSAQPRSRSAVQNGIRDAIADLWPAGIIHRGKDRDKRINYWLKSKHITRPTEEISSRTIQRVLKADREAHR